MIFDISFNDQHDIHLDKNDLAFSTEDNIVKQRLTIRLQFLLSEWFLDNRAGLPYTQFIFEQSSNLSDIYTLFRKEIKETEGVEKIIKLELTPDPGNKGLSVFFEVNNGISNIIEVTI